MTSPSSVRGAAPARGSTTPRLYTQPLPENCDPDREDACRCGCGLHPDSSWGFEVIAFLEGVLNWVLLPYQRWLYIHALEKNEDGGFRFETLIVLIARQNGKTQWLKGLGLWKLYLDGAEQVLLTAQNLDLAETTLSEAVADVKANLLLRKEYRRFSQTNGKFKLVLKSINEVRRAAGQKPLTTPGANSPREWRTTPATRRGGRSLSVDLAMLDELREHQNWKAWDAITPTTQSRPRSLTVGASNAGDATSIVLRSLRDGATAKILAGDTASTQIGLFEWSVPDDVDYTDPQFWPLANPGLGYLPGNTIRRLAGKLEAKKDDPAGFKTEYLCMWVSTMAPSVFPPADWKATTDPGSQRAPDSVVWASVDVNFERTKAYISISAPRSDGTRHVETVAAARGTDWVLPWFTDDQREGKFAGVVIQARGAPASGLIEPLQLAGVNVVEFGGPDLTVGYGDFYDKLTEHLIFHRPSPALDAAAGVAQAKFIGDAWVIDRKKGDASAVVACVQAEWAASRPEEEPQESAYERSDLVVL